VERPSGHRRSVPVHRTGPRRGQRPRPGLGAEALSAPRLARLGAVFFRLAHDVDRPRHRGARVPNFYESGQDITDLDDPTASYLRFITRIIGEYESLATIFNFTTVNAEQAINEQHQEVRRLFREREQRPWSDWNLEAYAEWLAQRASA